MAAAAAVIEPGDLLTFALEVHRRALLAAATSGSPTFFLGTESAPHAAKLKQASVCGAGCFTAINALELYATAFEHAGALDRLEGFASFHGADFYGLPRNKGTVTLERKAWTVPESVAFGEAAPGAALVPMEAGVEQHWKLA